MTNAVLSMSPPPLIIVPSAGFEPATLGLEGRCSIRLSYEGIVPKGGLEPPRSYEQRILSPLCLPIPPLRQRLHISSESGGSRTHDLRIKSPLLFQLSYRSVIYYANYICICLYPNLGTTR